VGEEAVTPDALSALLLIVAAADRAGPRRRKPLLGFDSRCATHAMRSGRPLDPFASYQRVAPGAARCLVSGIHPPDELLATEPHASTTTGSLQLARSNSPPNRDSMEPGKPFCFRVRQVGWLYSGCFHTVTSYSLLHSLLLYTGSRGILLN
jgi:hypothetical protein